MHEQNLKDAFVNGLLPIYNLFVISNHDILFDDMIDTIINKEPCIKKLYAINNDNAQKVFLEHTNRVEANNVTHTHTNNLKPKQQFNLLIDTIDNILNMLLDEKIIELPPIVKPKLPNGVPKHLHYEEFCK